MITNTTRMRLKTAGRLTFAAVAALGLAGAVASPASATPARKVNPCLVSHDLYQQPVAAVIATVEAPDGDCGVGTISLDVYRNGVLVGDVSGGPALNWRYDCVTTEPTVWSTNWDAPTTLNCG